MSIKKSFTLLTTIASLAFFVPSSHADESRTPDNQDTGSHRTSQTVKKVSGITRKVSGAVKAIGGPGLSGSINIPGVPGMIPSTPINGRASKDGVSVKVGNKAQAQTDNKYTPTNGTRTNITGKEQKKKVTLFGLFGLDR